jgi:hypothetical protein
MTLYISCGIRLQSGREGGQLSSLDNRRRAGGSWSDVLDIERVLTRLLAQLTRTGAFSPRSVDPRLQDPTSELIVEALFVEGPSNVSGLAKWIASTRGKCARKTVRIRLRDLSTLGIVAREPGGRYVLSASFTRTWARFLMGEIHDRR